MDNSLFGGKSLLHLSAVFQKVNKHYLTAIILVLFTYFYFRYAIEAKQIAFETLLLWFEQILPCQLTAMVLLQLWKKYGLIDSVNQYIGPLLAKLFGISKEGAFLLVSGIFFGFPAGAYALHLSLQDKKISEKEGNLLLPFINLLGPPFLFAYFYPTFQDTMPWFPTIAHFAAFYYGIPLGLLTIVGNVQRLLLKMNSSKQKATYSSSIDKHTDTTVHSDLPFSQILTEALCKVAMLAGYMIFFSTLQIVTIPMTGIPKRILSSSFEVSNATSRLMDTDPILGLSILCFGGISCIAQTKVLLPKGFHLANYIFWKILIAVIASILLRF